MRAVGSGRRKYQWTDELREELRAAYAQRRGEQRAAIDRLVRRTGWKRGAFTDEAVRLGIASERRRWTAEEDEWLLERVGTVSVKYLAKQLKRNQRAVEGRMFVLGARRIDRREGYTLSMLIMMFGSSMGETKNWIRRGLLGKVREVGCGQRVTDEAVLRFIRKYPHEYDLRRVDQVWFKSMVFGGATEDRECA